MSTNAYTLQLAHCAGMRQADADRRAGALSTDPLGDARTVEPFDIIEAVDPTLAQLMGAGMSEDVDTDTDAILAAWLEGYAHVAATPGVLVFIDTYLAAVAAWVSVDRWNGWACPFFTREEGERVAAQTAVLAASMNDPGSVEVVAWDESLGAFVGRSDDQPEGQVYDYKDGTVHPIGAYCWTWETTR